LTYPTFYFKRGPAAEHSTSHSVAQLRHLVAFTESSEKHEIIIPTDKEGFFMDRRPLRDVVTFNVQQGSEDTKTGAAWKFLIELGGAAQMRAKMASGSLVFRPLLLNDWVSEQSVPWVHYVPVQVRVARKSSQTCLINLSFYCSCTAAGSLRSAFVDCIF
jgi:hypothetical protein